MSKGCDSTASNLSTLCYIFIILVVLLWIKIIRLNIDLIEITKSDAEVKKGVIIITFLYTLLVFTPQLFIVYKMCRYKCKWLYFILYLFLLFIVFENIIQFIYVNIIGKTFPKWKITTMLYNRLKSYNFMNRRNIKYETINFDNENYIETILAESDKEKTIILYDKGKGFTELFSAIFRTLHTSSNFVSDENYIAVANIEGKLLVFDKKTNETYTYETSNCNAVAIEYYDYTFDEDFNTTDGYEFKKDEIYKEHVLVYNDGSTLYARSPVIMDNKNTPFQRDNSLEDVTANIDTIKITYEKDNDFLISVLSKDGQLTSVKRNKDGSLTLQT